MARKLYSKPLEFTAPRIEVKEMDEPTYRSFIVDRIKRFQQKDIIFKRVALDDIMRNT